MRDDAALANSILGSVASLEGNFDETVSRFSTALRLAPTNLDAYHNYLVGLRSLNAGEHLPVLIGKVNPETSSLPMMKVESVIALEDSGWIRASLSLAESIAQSDDSEEAIDALQRFGYDICDAKALCNVLDMAGMSDEQLVALVARSREVIRSEGLRIPIQKRDLVVDGATGGFCALWAFKANCGVERAFEIELKVIEELSRLGIPAYDEGHVAVMVGAMSEDEREQVVDAN